MTFLYIIPARAGSKGIPGKNKKLLNGYPLISYTLDCALKVTEPSNICVTTDDEDIALIAKQKNIDVPFMRPEKLAADNSSAFDVLKHALDFYEERGKVIDAVVLLQPTSPFRTADQLKAALTLYTQDLDMVVSVNKASSKLKFMETESGFLQLEANESHYELRQDAGNKYCFNGAIYIINSKSLRTKNVLEYQKVIKYEMDVLSSFDIDTPLDWEIANCLIKKVNV